MENFSSILLGFFEAVEHDPRIGASHVSLYCALYKQAAKSNSYLVQIKSDEIMKAAKISGAETYHKRIRELNDYGYIKYAPSFNHRKKSKVMLLNA